MFFRQCVMEKKPAFRIGWVPEKFAVIGKVLELKGDDGAWDNGWQVIQIGSRKSDKEANDRSQDYKRTRKASDI